MRFLTLVLLALSSCSFLLPAKGLTEILTESTASDWQALDDSNVIYLELPGGRVVIELAPQFAPRHVANIKALVAEGYYDGLAIVRSHDNYVVQWADPHADTAQAKRIVKAQRNLEPEYSVQYDDDFAFTVLADFDGYAPQVGHSNGFAAARDPVTRTTWLTHCYGAVGVSRGNANNSGDGTSLYVVTGNAPRHLDRNITVVGRVVQGMELLSSLKRGDGPLGFYTDVRDHVPIRSIKLATVLPIEQRLNIEVLRTDTQTFMAAVDSQRNRGGEWYKRPANYIALCNVTVPVRTGG